MIEKDKKKHITFLNKKTFQSNDLWTIGWHHYTYVIDGNSFRNSGDSWSITSRYRPASSFKTAPNSATLNTDVSYPSCWKNTKFRSKRQRKCVYSHSSGMLKYNRLNQQPDLHERQWVIWIVNGGSSDGTTRPKIQSNLTKINEIGVF